MNKYIHLDKKYDYTSQKSVYPAFFYLQLLFILRNSDIFL
ncbi:hypothetical protein M082_5048 [Bacteroides fragilis str. 3725 D9 ii]|nr:hypothetical protein M088_4244 [Bacteroides ovatus str. 3725 D1 iv]KDS15843.1 hypothetical protein M082_5048 [Bacteroides fragilis str. 3725 D9 ii]